MNKRSLIFVIPTLLAAIVAIYFLFKPNPILIGFQPGSVNYPMMHAVNNGFLEKQNLEFEERIFLSANDALDALLAESIFIDAVIPLQNIAKIEYNNPNTLGAIAFLISDKDHPLDYLIASPKSGINSPEDLNGKTLVVFPGTYSESMTKLTLEKIGVTNVKFIKRSPADMPAAIQTGQADAGIFYDPVATSAVKNGWGKLIEAAFWENHLMPNIVVGAYTYNKALSQRYPDEMNKIQKGIIEAILDSRQNPNEAKLSASKYLQKFSNILTEVPDSRVELSSEISIDIINETIKFYVDNNVLESYVDLKGLLKIE